VSGITTASSIALGRYHSCALLTDGKVLCWGNGYYGQLGDATTSYSTTPVEVSGITNVTSIALGGYHSCALLTGGTMKCLGDNNHGQLGDGTTTDHGTGDGTPVEVSGLILAFPLPPCTCCQARLKKLGLHVDEECRLF
jgi:alpha-tubulin suppressor-like RCC1 family protein